MFSVFVYSFISWLRWVLLLCAGFSRCRERAPFSRCGVRLLLRRRLLSPGTGLGLEGFRSCGSWAPEHRLTASWDPPGSGIERTCLALAAGLLTTGPPGKPCSLGFYRLVWALCSGGHILSSQQEPPAHLSLARAPLCILAAPVHTSVT